MKKRLLIFFLFPVIFLAAQPPLIHAHNDYQKPEPLFNALRNKAFSIEADIYLTGDKLMVAHEKNELPGAKTLEAQYLQPIIKLFQQYHGAISTDSNYVPVLMIDIKENGEAAIAALIKLLDPYHSVFDRSINKRAVQVVISGDRTEPSKWNSYPSYIFFDGRPTEEYDKSVLQRVAFISDSYFNYVRPADSIDVRIKQLALKAHGVKKLLRLWAIPDNPDSWNHLLQLGVDIINTDKVAECRKYFH